VILQPAPSANPVHNLFITQHPAWSVKAAARARLDGWILYYAPAALPPGQVGIPPVGPNPPALPLVLPALNLPEEF